MTYVPTSLLNENYSYSINNNVITVYKECYSNICTCNNIYPLIDYNISEDYSCNSTDIIMLDHNNITDDFYYRVDFTNILIIFIILSFFIIYCPLAIIRRFFKRYR